MPGTVCDHLEQLENPAPSGAGCVECLAEGGQWVHLRRCLTCGHIGCCDSSPGTHATRHFHATTHPLIQSYEPGEEWIWCYVEEVAFELPDFPGSSHP